MGWKEIGDSIILTSSLWYQVNDMEVHLFEKNKYYEQLKSSGGRDGRKAG